MVITLKFSKAVLSLPERPGVCRSVIASPRVSLPSLTCLAAGHLGFGKDMWGIAPNNITASLKVSFALNPRCVLA
jgi:hypothetical protein